MKNVLIFAAVGEAGTGLAMLIIPSLFGQLLLGEELTGVAIPVARVAGIALIALGITCWPGTPLVGMLTYGTFVALYLTYLGFAGGLAGAECPGAICRHVMDLTPPPIIVLTAGLGGASGSWSSINWHRNSAIVCISSSAPS